MPGTKQPQLYVALTELANGQINLAKNFQTLQQQTFAAMDALSRYETRMSAVAEIIGISSVDLTAKIEEIVCRRADVAAADDLKIHTDAVEKGLWAPADVATEESRVILSFRLADGEPGHPGIGVYDVATMFDAIRAAVSGKSAGHSFPLPKQDGSSGDGRTATIQSVWAPVVSPEAAVDMAVAEAAAETENAARS